MTTDVHDVPEDSRYELTLDGTVAAVVGYAKDAGLIDLQHTETRDGFERRGLAGELVAAVLDDARSHGWHVRPSCPYVRNYLLNHRDELDLVSAADREAFELPPA